MMSTLVCTKCGNVAVETSRAVVLPYVCTGCQPHDQEADVHQEPSQGNYGGAQTIAAAFADPQLRDSSATVDATIAMVADLEEQLTVAKELSAGQTELISQLEQQVAILNSDLNGERTGYDIAKLEAESAIEEAEELAEQNAAMRERLLDNIHAMTGGINEILRLQKENAELQERNDWQKSTLETVTDSLVETTDIAKALAFYLGHAVETGKKMEADNNDLRLAIEAFERSVLAVARG